MVRGKAPEEHLSEEEIQQRVNQVMDQWQSYPDFAHLFDALLTANQDMLGTELAQRYAEEIGAEEPSSALVNTIQDVRSGRRKPTYQLVADLALHNLLGLDRGRVGPASPDHPAGAHRIALFAAAGLIEVTPESVRDWNRDVLASWQRRREQQPVRPVPTWKDLMQKLLAFHTQGNRMSWDDLAARARDMAGDANLLPGRRLNTILTSRNVPTQQERLTLARAVGLEPGEVEFIEEAIEAGSLSVSKHASKTPFSILFDHITNKLKANGISLPQLALRSRDPLTGQGGVVHQVLSSWRLGRVRPSLGNLRALVGGLRSCSDQAGSRLVTEEEIQSLTEASGFTPHELIDTSHDVIARIGDGTRIKPLLGAIRNAVDVSIPASALPTGPAGGIHLTTGMVANWESEKTAEYPTESQVRVLLDRYNTVMRQEGHLPLSDPEIDRVIAVAERDRVRWEGLPQAEKRRGGPQYGRRLLLSPSFDDGPAR